MSGIFRSGETKVRPGSYYRYENASKPSAAGARDGVVAAVFESSWGPLGQVVRITNLRDLSNQFGNGGTVDTVKYALQGGAATVLGIRLGHDGTSETAVLYDTQESSPVEVVKLTARHIGKPGLSIKIQESLADESKKEALLFVKGAQVAKVSFAKGADEAQAFADALNALQTMVTATVSAQGNGELALVNQSFSGGEDPVVDPEDYANALETLEAERWNVLVVDTSEKPELALVKAYMDRVTNNGLMSMAVLGKPVDLKTRIDPKQDFDSANIVYVVNGGYDDEDNLIDGYRAAAIVGGMAASIPSNDSLTHKMVPGLTRLAAALSNTQIEDCITGGVLAFTTSQSGRVWVESGINTLINLAKEQDAGWKKIRRTKTRYELISRINEVVEPIIGSITNDNNGRTTVVSLAQGVLNRMIAENKLLSATIIEDESNPPEGDSASFVLDILDLDSLEKIYLLYNFSFSGQ